MFVSWKWTPQTRKEGKLRKYDILADRGRAKSSCRYIKRYGPFEGTQNDVRLLIGIIKHLVERRKRITNLIGRFTQSSTLCARESERVRHAYELGYEGLSDEIDARHIERMEQWKAKKALKAQQQAELDAREAIPDPDDYIDLFVLPPDPFDEEEGALPTSTSTKTATMWGRDPGEGFPACP